MRIIIRLVSVQGATNTMVNSYVSSIFLYTFFGHCKSIAHHSRLATVCTRAQTELVSYALRTTHASHTYAYIIHSNIVAPTRAFTTPRSCLVKQRYIGGFINRKQRQCARIARCNVSRSIQCLAVGRPMGIASIDRQKLYNTPQKSIKIHKNTNSYVFNYILCIQNIRILFKQIYNTNNLKNLLFAYRVVNEL